MPFAVVGDSAPTPPIHDSNMMITKAEAHELAITLTEDLKSDEDHSVKIHQQLTEELREVESQSHKQDIVAKWFNEEYKRGRVRRLREKDSGRVFGVAEVFYKWLLVSDDQVREKCRESTMKVLRSIRTLSIKETSARTFTVYTGHSRTLSNTHIDTHISWL